MRRNKFNAIRTTVDGIIFASRREAKRYAELKLMERAGEIESLECQPSFRIEVSGIRICDYRADFKYLDKRTGEWITEDVKSKATMTPVFKIKARLLRACHGIQVMIT